MYSVLSYGHMARDGVRIDAYARAIQRVVRPGSVVLDLGAGTGICSLLAARAGAARVHAVEPNPAVWLLPSLAAENRVADRITVHAASSFDLVLPEKVDVIISDLRGSVPLHEDNVRAVSDARNRWLKPGGVVLPTRDRLFVAAVEAEDLVRDIARGSEGFERQTFSAGALRSSLLNDVYTDKSFPIHASNVLTTSEVWTTVEYTAETPGVAEGTVDLAVTRQGIAHGLAVWFEATVLDELTFTNAPGSMMVYARLFLPFAEPVSLAHGDRARVTVRADQRGDRWGWDASVVNAAGATKASFRQSTFLGAPASAETLLRGAGTHRPVRSPRGARLRRILEAMDGLRSIAEIATQIASEDEAGLSADARARILDEVRSAVQRYGG